MTTRPRIDDAADAYRQELLGNMSPRQLDAVCGLTTRVEVDVTYTIHVDVPCDPDGDAGDDDASLARRAVELVRGMRLPVLCRPDSPDVVRPEVVYYGAVYPGCPPVGYGTGTVGQVKGLDVTRRVTA